jgi:hypothetical protein
MPNKRTPINGKNENILISILFNIVIPVIILLKLSGTNLLGPFFGLVTALVFPISYGIYNLTVRKKKSLTSIIGFVSILLTGIISLLKFPPEMIAIKEAFIPFIIGVINLVSIQTRFPLVKTLLLNKEIVDAEKIETALSSTGNKPLFEKMLARASVYLSASFFLSAFLNYMLAEFIIQSEPGTAAFNEELGKMTMLSFPVIALPSTIITALIFLYLFVSIKKLTGLSSGELFSEKVKGNIASAGE